MKLRILLLTLCSVSIISQETSSDFVLAVSNFEIQTTSKNVQLLPIPSNWFLPIFKDDSERLLLEMC